LALDLSMTVEQLINTMSNVEFRGWIKYFEIIAEEQRRATKKSPSARRR